MRLSNKKIKYVKRHADERTPGQIAEQLRVSVKEVEKVLRELGKDVPTGPVFDHHDKVDRVYFWVAAACMGLPALAVWPGIYDFANLPQSAFVQVAVVFLLLLWCAKALWTGRGRFLFTPFALPCFLFLAWCLISFVWAHNRYEAAVAWMHWTACGLGLLAAANAPARRADVGRLLKAVFLSGLLVSVLGIVQHLFRIEWLPQVVPPAATFANKNVAAEYVVLTWPLGLGLLLSTRSRGQSWFFSLACSLMVVFLVYAAAKAGWMALVLQTVFLVCMVGRRRPLSGLSFPWNRQKLHACLGGLVCFLILFNMGPEGLQWRAGRVFETLRGTAAAVFESRSPADPVGGSVPASGNEREELPRQPEPTGDDMYGSVGLRLDIFRNTLAMIGDRLAIGVGLGNHKVHYPLYARRAAKEKVFSEELQLTNVHNDYLQAFAELGLVGMALLAWLGWTVLRVLGRVFGPGQQEDRLWVLVMGAGILGLAVDAHFSFPFQRALPPFILACYLGLCGFLAAHGKQGRGLALSPRLVLVATLALLVCLPALVRLEYRWIKCDRYFLGIVSAEKAGVWQGVLWEARQAISYNKHRKKIYSYMGRALIETGQPEKAIPLLQEVIAAYPNHMNALLNLGVAYGSIGEYDKALDAYARVMRIKPDYAKLHNNMANIYVHQKRHGEALEHFRLAAQYDLKSAAIRLNLGIVALNTGHYDEARQAFEEAVALKPDWDLAHKNLAIVCYQYLGEKKKAAEHFRKALALNPRLEEREYMERALRSLEKEEQ